MSEHVVGQNNDDVKIILPDGRTVVLSEKQAEELAFNILESLGYDL